MPSYREIDPLIKAVCQLDDGLEKIDELVKRLIPLYQEMVRHMRAAKDPKHVVDVLLEHAAAVILLKDTEKVISDLYIPEIVVLNTIGYDFTYHLRINVTSKYYCIKNINEDESNKKNQ